MVIRHRPIHVHQYTFAAAGGMITENRTVFVNELSEKKCIRTKSKLTVRPKHVYTKLYLTFVYHAYKVQGEVLNCLLLQ